MHGQKNIKVDLIVQGLKGTQIVIHACLPRKIHSHKALNEYM